MPKIHIESEPIDKMNKEIYDIFKTKMASILKNKETEYSIYNIDVVTYKSDDIISMGIKCTLKEGASAQRLIMKTYNYDTKNDTMITIEDVAEKYNIDLNKLQEKIYSKIEQEIKRVETLKSQGYDIYTRVSKDSIYDVAKIEDFLIDTKNKVIYVIYAYGNNNYTSELDLVVYDMTEQR